MEAAEGPTFRIHNNCRFAEKVHVIKAFANKGQLLQNTRLILVIAAIHSAPKLQGQCHRRATVVKGRRNTAGKGSPRTTNTIEWLLHKNQPNGLGCFSLEKRQARGILKRFTKP